MKLLNPRPLFFAALCYLAGLLIGFSLRSGEVYFFALCLISLILYFALKNWKQRLLLIYCAILCLAIGVSACYDPLILGKNDIKVEFTGEVSSVREYERYNTYVVDSEVAVDLGAKKTLTFATSSSDKTLKIGDRISGLATLTPPKPPEWENAFNDVKYCASRGINYRARLETFEKIGQSQGFLKFIGDLRCAVGEKIESLFPENSGVFRAMMTGDRSGIDDATLSSYRSSGISHVLVVSGLHVGIITLFLLWLLKVLRVAHKPRYFITLCILVLFCIFTGGATSIVRATIMAAVMLISKALNSKSDSLSALSLAFLICVLPNPAAIFDVGLQLSFGTVFSIICLTPVLSRYIKTGNANLSALLCASLAATLVSSLIIINMSNALNPLSVFVNVVAVAIVGVSLPLAMLGLILGSIFPPMGVICVVPDFLQSAVGDLSALVENISFPVPNISPLILIIVFAAVLLYSNMLNMRAKWLITVISSLIITAISFIPLLTKPDLKIEYLSVGAADCAVIETQNLTILIDTGQDETASNFLLKNGKKPDIVILSHTHYDHAGGLSYIINADSGFFRNADSPVIYTSAAMANSLGEGFPAVALREGDNLHFGEGEIEVLFAPENNNSKDANNDSLILLLKYRGRNICLFTGDAPTKTLETSVWHKMRIDVLKVSHHGSATGASQTLIDRLTPELAVISGAKPPSAKTLATLQKVPVFFTNKTGTVTVGYDIIMNRNVSFCYEFDGFAVP